jgi:hypothetical protein
MSAIRQDRKPSLMAEPGPAMDEFTRFQATFRREPPAAPSASHPACMIAKTQSVRDRAARSKDRREFVRYREPHAERRRHARKISWSKPMRSTH